MTFLKDSLDYPIAEFCAVVGGSPARLLSCGLLACSLYWHWRRLLSSSEPWDRRLIGRIPITAAVIGILVLGAIFAELEDLWHQTRQNGAIAMMKDIGDQRLRWSDIRRILPCRPFRGDWSCHWCIARHRFDAAAAIGYATGRRFHERRKAPDEPGSAMASPKHYRDRSANSSVSGAYRPVLSLGIPGNTAAVFLILAAKALAASTRGHPCSSLQPTLTRSWSSFSVCSRQ